MAAGAHGPARRDAGLPGAGATPADGPGECSAGMAAGTGDTAGNGADRGLGGTGESSPGEGRGDWEDWGELKRTGVGATGAGQRWTSRTGLVWDTEGQQCGWETRRQG